MIARSRIPSKSEYKEDAQFVRSQSNQSAIVSAINSQPFANGILVGPVDLAAATPTALNHKLGRTPQGWFPVRVQGDYGQFYESASDDKTLTLVSSAAVTASFWVF